MGGRGGKGEEEPAVLVDVSSRGSAPSPEAPDVIVQHQKLLEHRHALAFAPELGEQLAQPPATRDVEPERLGEILLRVRRGVRSYAILQRGGDAATLEVDPFQV